MGEPMHYAEKRRIRILLYVNKCVCQRILHHSEIAKQMSLGAVLIVPCKLYVKGHNNTVYKVA
jgi:hypothetical protein